MPCVLASGALIVASPGPAAAAAIDPVVLKPQTPWVSDWSGESCSLRRNFGATANENQLLIERDGPTEQFRLTLFGDALAAFASGTRLTVTFGNREPIVLHNAAALRSTTGKPAIFIGGITLGGLATGRDEGLVRPTVSLAEQAAITSVTVTFSGHSLVYDTGRLDKPFAAMRECTDDIVRSWGLDPQQQATLSAPVEPANNAGAWATDADYPAAMLRSRAQATVPFRLMVDADGKVTACHVQHHLGNPGFDQTTCNLLMRRGRFRPARDAAGKPVPSYYLNRINWIMPG